MTISEYWKNKTDMLNQEVTTKEWAKKYNIQDKEEQIQIRKLLVSQMMDIPINRIPYYLERDEWLLNFALDNPKDKSALNNFKNMERGYIEKLSTKNAVSTLLKKCFYEPDYAALCKMDKSNQCNVIVEPSKSDVEYKIKELLDGDKVLSYENQRELAVYEQVYFEPLELTNNYMEEVLGKENFYSLLVEQWKTANEMAANISAQRTTMNNFFMSMMSIFVGGVLLSNDLLNKSVFIRLVLYVIILVVGNICCKKWNDQIDNYKKLNSAKYDVINKLERFLPANVLSYEYQHSEKSARRSKRKKNFTEQEKEIANMFRRIISLVSIVMIVFTCLSTWGELIWNSLKIMLNVWI